MATQQPNLPNYQLSKAPELQLGMINQMSQNLTGAMDKLAERTRANKKARQELNMKADAMSNEFMKMFTDLEGSNVANVDAANRQWATKTARRLSDLYTKAYGSNGTQEARDLYMKEYSLANENLKTIGTWANLEQKNQSAVTLNAQADKQGSKGLNLLGGKTLHGNLNEQYARSTFLKNQQGRDYVVETDPNTGHVRMKFNIWDPTANGGKGGYMQGDGGKYDIDMNAEVNTFNNHKKGLSYYTITNEDDLQTYLLEDKKNFDPLYNAAGRQITKTTYTKGKGGKPGFYRQKTIDFQTLKEADEDGKLTNYLMNKVGGDRFFAKWVQMQKNTNNPLGDMPGADLTWHQASDMTTEELKAFTRSTDTNNDGVIDSNDAIDTDKKIFDMDGDGEITAAEINAIQDQTAAAGLLNSYQVLSSQGEQVIAESSDSGRPREVTGKFKAPDINTWANEGNRQSFNDRSANSLKIATEVTNAATADAGASAIATLYSQNKSGNYMTGKEIKNSGYPGADSPEFQKLNNNYIYKVEFEKDQGTQFKKIPTGIEINNYLDNQNDVYNKLMNEIYDYDGDDLYYFGTDEGKAVMDDEFTRIQGN